MVLHKKADEIEVKEGYYPLQGEFLQISSAFLNFWANSVKRSQTQLDLERMQVARARHLCRTIGPLF